MAMNKQLDAISQDQVFGDFVELLEERKTLSFHRVNKIERNGAGNVQRSRLD